MEVLNASVLKIFESIPEDFVIYKPKPKNAKADKYHDPHEYQSVRGHLDHPVTMNSRKFRQLINNIMKKEGDVNSNAIEYADTIVRLTEEISTILTHAWCAWCYMHKVDGRVTTFEHEPNYGWFAEIDALDVVKSIPQCPDAVINLKESRRFGVNKCDNLELYKLDRALLYNDDLSKTGILKAGAKSSYGKYVADGGYDDDVRLGVFKKLLRFQSNLIQACFKISGSLHDEEWAVHDRICNAMYYIYNCTEMQSLSSCLLLAAMFSRFTVVAVALIDKFHDITHFENIDMNVFDDENYTITTDERIKFLASYKYQHKNLRDTTPAEQKAKGFSAMKIHILEALIQYHEHPDVFTVAQYDMVFKVEVLKFINDYCKDEFRDGKVRRVACSEEKAETTFSFFKNRMTQLRYETILNNPSSIAELLNFGKDFVIEKFVDTLTTDMPSTSYTSCPFLILIFKSIDSDYEKHLADRITALLDDGKINKDIMTCILRLVAFCESETIQCLADRAAEGFDYATLHDSIEQAGMTFEGSYKYKDVSHEYVPKDKLHFAYFLRDIYDKALRRSDKKPTARLSFAYDDICDYIDAEEKKQSEQPAMPVQPVQPVQPAMPVQSVQPVKQSTKQIVEEKQEKPIDEELEVKPKREQDRKQYTRKQNYNPKRKDDCRRDCKPKKEEDCKEDCKKDCKKDCKPKREEDCKKDCKQYKKQDDRRNDSRYSKGNGARKDLGKFAPYIPKETKGESSSSTSKKDQKIESSQRTVPKGTACEQNVASERSSPATVSRAEKFMSVRNNAQTSNGVKNALDYAPHKPNKKTHPINQ